MPRLKRLAALFADFFRLSLFVVGGGYAILAVADEVFARRAWTKEGELLDRLPVFQMLPGLIATHTAVYVGRKVAGAWGAFVAVVAVALPSVAIFTFVARGYAICPLENALLQSVFLGLRAALTGIIAAAVIRSWKGAGRDPFFYALLLAGVLALAVARVAAAWVILAAMLCGLASVRPGRRRYCVSLLPFAVFLKYGLLGFGGGFVLVPMYVQDFVGPAAAYLQLPFSDFSNVMALSQMTPGPIGVNAATFFGYRLGGVGGAALASLCLLLPGSLLAYGAFRSLERFQANRWVRGLLRGVKPASVALMLVALLSFAETSLVSPLGAALVVANVIAAWRRLVPVLAQVAVSAALGGLMGM